MRSGWNGAAPPALPPRRFRERLRLYIRAPIAVLWLAGCVALLFACRGLDRLLGRRGDRALAPGVVRLWARGALRLLGLRAVTRGAAMEAPGALVANHTGWIDVVALMSVTRVNFVSKAEVSGWPVIGALGKAIGTEFIERRATETRRQADRLGARLARGDRLCLFPEGTSSDGQRVLPFKSALFGMFLDPGAGASVRVQPVSLRYRPGADLPAALYGWWGEMDFGPHLTEVLARSTGGVAEIAFHHPIDPHAAGNRKALAAEAEFAVRSGWENGGDGL